VMLYTRHLGFKGKFTEALAAGDPKARELQAQVARVEDEMLRRDDIRARAVYKFFRAYGEGDSLVITCPEGDHVKERFAFGRQAKDGGLCLADFTAARDSGRADYVAMLATTVGPGVRALADQWKAAGDYLKSHILQILALEGAETGIRTNVVNPDAVIRGSRIWGGSWRQERAAQNRIADEEIEDFYRKRSLLKRSVLPEDVAEAVYFFASELSAKSTGNILNVDAGNATAFTR